MDLLATVRKEGSRGGRGDFKWSDVQNSARREHYLGHSLMAPVGRWAKGRDPSWYARDNEASEDGEDPAEKAKRERLKEIQLVKQAEEDALARALGLPVAPRNNANLEPVSDKRQIDNDAAKDPENEKSSGRALQAGSATQEKELQSALKEYRRRHRDDDDRTHSSTSHDRHRHHHRSTKDSGRDKHGSRRRSRSRENHRSRRSRSRSPTRHERRCRDRSRSNSRSRSRSPYRSQRQDRKRH